MDNIVKIRILGTEFKVYTEEGEEHAKRIAAAVDAKTKEIMGEDQYAPSTRVALIAAMDFCESEIKYHRIATKLKKRLEKATEELDRLSKGAGDGDYIEEITSLEEKLAAAEKTAKAKDDEIALLKEDLASLEEYRRDLAAKEKELEDALKINDELEAALKKAETKIAELTADIEDDDFDFDEDFEEEKSEEPEDDSDIIIPGYLDEPEEQVEDEDSQIENPFGLDFGN